MSDNEASRQQRLGEELAWDGSEVTDRIKADAQTFAFMSALANLAESTAGLLNIVILEAVLLDDVPSFREALQKLDDAMEIMSASRQSYLAWLDMQDS